MVKTVGTLGSFTLGLFGGAMLFIALAIIPQWNSLDPVTYRVYFQSMGPFIGTYMVPLMVAAILLSATNIYLNKGNRAQWIVATVFVAAIVPLYGAVHAPVNDLVLGGTPLSDTELLVLRSKWVVWHWVRTLLGCAAFLVSLQR